MSTFVKDPNANLDYTINWANLLAGGETIQTSTWIVPAGLTKGAEPKTDTTTTVWLSGGTTGQDYVVTNRITTSQSRTDDRSIRIYVRER